MSMPIVTRTRTEVIKLWVAALRSGKYKQTKDSLKDHKGFCCWGVLCDLAAKDGGVQWDGEQYDGPSGRAPARMARFIGAENNFQAELEQRNDGTGEYKKHTFKQIAEIIEKKLL